MNRNLKIALSSIATLFLASFFIVKSSNIFSTAVPIADRVSVKVTTTDLPRKNGVSVTTLSPQKEHDWMTAYTPLSDKEAEEFEIVPEQMKYFFTQGKMNPDRVRDFRSAVYRFDARGLAHIGRTLAFETQDMARTKEGADKIITLVDTLGYFAAHEANYPAAIEIIRDLATQQSIIEDATSRPSIVATRYQLFEQYARFRPVEARDFIKSSVSRPNRATYIYYFKTGRIIAGIGGEALQAELSTFSKDT